MGTRRNEWHYLIHICKQLLRSRLAMCILLLILSLATIVINMFLLGRTASPEQHTSPIGLDHSVRSQATILWVYHKKEEPLSHVISVFNRIGYSQGSQLDNWNVMWSHEYPFHSLPRSLWAELKPHQRVNHFPGSGCFTFKPQLATMDYEFVPKAFQLPKQSQEFLTESRAQPDLLWVMKDNNHRRIKIVNDVTRIDLHKEGSFVQQFVSNPLLIDGRKFDIGIYTVITSVNPLRAYIYSGEVLVRFCSEDYEPFDALKPKKYVVDDHYTLPSEIHSIAPLLSEQSFSNKEALNFMLKKKGFNPEDMWMQVEEAIRKVLLRCEPNIVSHINKLSSSPRHYFELVRFDFVIDDKLKAWLMEVNLSPNLSSDHFSENRHMYEQVVFNVLSLVGLARPSHEALRYNGQFESVMLVNDRDIQVPLEQCANGMCAHCSEQPICKLCKPCRSADDSFNLKMAFLEHTQSDSVPDGLSHANHMMSMWFREKCRTQSSWCL